MASVNTESGNHLSGKIGLILASGFLYSVTIACVDVAADYIPPVTLTALRLSTASATFCGILFFLRPKYWWSLRGVADIFAIGLLNVAIPFLFLALAVEYISSSLVAVLFNAQPVFTIVIAHFLLADEKLSAVKLAGTIAAVAGATILVVSNASGLEIEHDQGWIGQFLILTASLAGALGVVYTRIRLRHENAVVLAAGQVFASLVIFVPLTLVAEGLPAFASYPWRGWAGMIVAGLSAPVAAFCLLFYIVPKLCAWHMAKE